MSSGWYGRLKSSRVGRTVQWTVNHRNRVILGFSATYLVTSYFVAKRQAYKRDFIHQKSYLVWRIHDGAIVEQKSPGTALNYLLANNATADEPPRVLTLFEALRTLKFIEQDDRIAGLIADFTTTGVPSVPSYTLGLAQIEELHDAVLSIKLARRESAAEKAAEITENTSALSENTEFEPFRTIAIADTFQSQGDYALSTAFDEIYVQPMGDVPLLGLSATIPFWSRLLQWAGIKIHAEARTKWKSMISPYVYDELTPEQKENEVELLNGLNDNLCTLIARGRFPADEPAVALEKVKGFTRRGPFTANEAKELGLITDTKYKHQVLKTVVDDDVKKDIKDDTILSFVTKSDKPRLHGFYHYFKTMDKLVDKSNDVLEVGVVYLLGTIGEAGEFSTSTVIRGLKEAANDDSIQGIVLRIDSGGGGVVDSDSIWAAVEHAKSKGKTVIASFGNAAASGGYLVATHADAILADASTITGSIGVASLRPTVTQTFLDRLKLTVESFFMGSKAGSIFHDLTGDDLERHKAHIDATYDTFKGLVCSGRQISNNIIEDVAGGRVLTGLKAFCQSGPPGMKEILAKRQNFLGGDDQETEEMMTSYAAIVSQSLKGGGESEGPPLDTVELDPDSATSPFAVPVSNETKTSDLTVNEGLQIQPDGSAVLALPAEKVQAILAHKKKWGRGLVDGLGSIHDAAVMAGEIGLARAMEKIKLENPDLTEAELIDRVLPGFVVEEDSDGQIVTQMDINLKVFPEQKGIWETATERARRGDAIDPSMVSVWHTFKIAAAAFVLQAAHRALSEELGTLGLDALRRPQRQQRVAEYSGLGMRYSL